MIVDSSSLDFWPKYSYLEDRWKSDSNKEIEGELSFSIWLRILEKQIICNESLLDIKGKKISNTRVLIAYKSCQGVKIIYKNKIFNFLKKNFLVLK